MTRRRTTRCCGKDQQDRGISLIELTVAMATGVILLAVTGTIFTSLTGTIRSTADQADRATGAQVARETIDRSLHAADAVPPVTDGTGQVIIDGQAGELTVTTGFTDATAASALADLLDTKVGGSGWAAELRATGLVPRKVRYAYQAGAAACGNVNGILEQVWPIGGVTYSATTRTFSVTWGSVISTRCVLRTDLAPRFTYSSDCPGTTALTAPLAGASLATVRAVGYTLFAGTKAETVGRICLVNSGS